MSNHFDAWYRIDAARHVPPSNNTSSYSSDLGFFGVHTVTTADTSAPENQATAAVENTVA